MRAPSPAVLWIVLLAGLTCALIVVAIATPPPIVGYDFLAFWCGAKAVLAGASPYLNEPLHACERANAPAFFLTYPNVTVPAPLPPYALALFTPLALLPYALARAVWWLVLVACILIEGRLIAKLTGRSYAFGLIVCSLALTGPIIIQGALAPLPILLLTAGACALKARRFTLGGLALAAAMIEPHMALPACIAAFVFVPRARIALAIAGVFAAALAVFVVGTQGFISYLTVVLPTHAHAELDNLSQDSLTAILHHLGVADEFALRTGGLQYAAFVGVGIVLAARLYRRDGDAAWPVLVPAAFAMIGGEFIHLSEVAMAIPLAAILAVRIGGIAWLPLVLLVLPGESIVNDGRDFLPAALVAALLLRELGVRGPYVIGGSFIVLTGAIVAHAFAMEQVGVLSGAIAAPAPGALASLTWEAWNRLSFIGPMWWLEKTLTLVPLLGLAALTLRFAYPTDRAAAAQGSVPVPT